MESALTMGFRQGSAVPVNEAPLDSNITRLDRLKLKDFFKVWAHRRAIVPNTRAHCDAMERIAHGRIGQIILGRFHCRALLIREVREPCFQDVVQAEKASIMIHKFGSATPRLSPLSVRKG